MTSVTTMSLPAGAAGGRSFLARWGARVLGCIQQSRRVKAERAIRRQHHLIRRYRATREHVSIPQVRDAL